MCSHGLKLPVFAMGMMLPPLNTEHRQKYACAGYLSRNSADKCAAYESGTERNSCGDQRRSNIAPGILPTKYPPQGGVTQDALDDIRQENTDCCTQRAKPRNQPEKSADSHRACDGRMQKIQMRTLHHDHGFA